MLYRRKNDGSLVDEDDASEIVKYINTVLKVDFDLDTTSKPKPVVGPDDLLLLLVQHWARDESVFPTENDRHDMATIMLFNSYTAGHPVEFVHASKGNASQDPLGEADETSKCETLPDVPAKYYDDESDAGDGPQYDDDDDDDDDLSDADDPDLFDEHDPSADKTNIDGGTHDGPCRKGAFKKTTSDQEIKPQNDVLNDINHFKNNVQCWKWSSLVIHSLPKDGRH